MSSPVVGRETLADLTSSKGLLEAAIRVPELKATVEQLHDRQPESLLENFRRIGREQSPTDVRGMRDAHRIGDDASTAEDRGDEEHVVYLAGPDPRIQDMIDGFNLYWEQNGLEVAGREVEIFIEDSTGDPDVALSKARLLVEQREVDMLIGTLFANEGLAVAEYVRETGTPTFYQIAAADDLTQRNRVPNLIRVAGWTSSGPHHPFGEWVAKNQECKSVYTLGSDYAFGHEVIGGFVNTFTDNGGTVQKQVWNPIGEADFSSYLAAILDAQPDCVFALEVGATAVRFQSAWNDFGLRDEIPLYLGEVPADVSILRGIEPPERPAR